MCTTYSLYSRVKCKVNRTCTLYSLYSWVKCKVNRTCTLYSFIAGWNVKLRERVHCTVCIAGWNVKLTERVHCTVCIAGWNVKLQNVYNVQFYSWMKCKVNRTCTLYSLYSWVKCKVNRTCKLYSLYSWVKFKVNRMCTLYDLYRWVKYKCILYINDRAGADNFRIVDIKFLAWSSFFHLIRLFSSLVCILKIKFNQSEWRMQNPKQPISSREIWSLRAILWENSRWSTGKDITKREGKSGSSRNQKCEQWIFILNDRY